MAMTRSTIDLNLPGTGMFATEEAPSPQPTPGNTATDAQVRFIRTLLAERAGTQAAEAVRATLNDLREQQKLTKKVASATIEALKAMPVNKRSPQAPAKVRPNQYAKACDLCGRTVGAGEGALDKSDDNKWIVTHVGECPSAFPFPEGSYALNVDVNDNGDGEVKFYQASEDGHLYIQAGDELYRLTGDTREAAIEAIAVDPAEAAMRYGQELGVCGACGRTLTSEWRLRGIGPVCARKRGWA